MPLGVLCLDFNSYFASVEQQRHSGLRGQPVEVLPVIADSTSCIAASYMKRESSGSGIRPNANRVQ